MNLLTFVDSKYCNKNLGDSLRAHVTVINPNLNTVSAVFNDIADSITEQCVKLSFQSMTQSRCFYLKLTLLHAKFIQYNHTNSGIICSKST